MILIQNEADRIPIARVQPSTVLRRQRGIVFDHLIIRQFSSLHAAHVCSRLFFGGRTVKKQAGVTGKDGAVERPIKRVRLDLRVFKRIGTTLIDRRDVHLGRQPLNRDTERTHIPPHGVQFGAVVCAVDQWGAYL